jgi:hypothetical protein
MDWNPGDQVLHPRRPDWGRGIIQPGAAQTRVNVSFANAGMKVIDLKIVELLAWSASDDLRNSAAATGERKILKLMKPNRLLAPKVFNSEFVFEYPPAWRQFFDEGSLIQDWFRAYPDVFTEEEYEYALDNSNKKRLFHQWLGAALVKEQFKFPSLINWAAPFLENTQKKVKHLLGDERMELIRKEKPVYWRDAPELMVYRVDGSKVSLILLHIEGTKIDIKRLEGVVNIRKLIDIDVFCIRLRAKDHVHILH